MYLKNPLIIFEKLIMRYALFSILEEVEITSILRKSQAVLLDYLQIVVGHGTRHGGS